MGVGKGRERWVRAIKYTIRSRRVALGNWKVN